MTVKNRPWKCYVFWIILCELVGALSGLLSKDGMEQYLRSVAQPKFAPPAAVFPIVWTFLYALMGIGMARIWLYGTAPKRYAAQNLFLIQLILNFFWPLIFFNAMAFGFAFLWIILLWILVLAMLLAFWKQDRLAGLLQLPYLLWITFAAFLSFTVWMQNP